MLKVEELRQSLRILQQCLDNMPEGPFKADHPLTTPPPKERTLQHIETLITHFLQVSWGPGDAGAGVLPDGGSDEGD
ncbi:NADH dehydrogenase I chain C; chain D [Salmonella enterica subsp. enterica]|uniref:NADH dehydrogenase I chain C chain D n=1 Tax=Salmonella enterica I TaxID=59201 RepID=A0A3S5DCT2_SALET|nr:NADH dehydrogenase I chain C; chain D [Salmonella enterica subsp. enterica]